VTLLLGAQTVISQYRIDDALKILKLRIPDGLGTLVSRRNGKTQNLPNGLAVDSKLLGRLPSSNISAALRKAVMRYTFTPPQPKISAALEEHYYTGVYASDL